MTSRLRNARGEKQNEFLKERKPLVTLTANSVLEKPYTLIQKVSAMQMNAYVNTGTILTETQL